MMGKKQIKYKTRGAPKQVVKTVKNQSKGVLDYFRNRKKEYNDYLDARDKREIAMLKKELQKERLKRAIARNRSSAEIANATSRKYKEKSKLDNSDSPFIGSFKY